MQHNAKDIPEAIAAARAEGVLESSASFMLDPAEALRKSGSYQLPQQELWIVKIIQAAVSAGAESIDVKLERACVKVSVKGGQFSSAADIAEQVSFKSDISTQGHLLTGLRVLAVEAGTAFVLQTANPSPEKIVVNAENLPKAYKNQVLSPDLSLSLLVFRKGSVRANVKALISEVPVENLARARASEYLALVRHCWVSTVPITVDGRPLETRFYRCTEGLEEGGLTANFPCSMASGPAPLFQGRPRLDMRRPEKLGEEELPGLFIAKRVYRDTHFLVRDPELDAGAFLDIQMGTKDLVVIFVCDGALVSSHRVKLKVPSFRRFPSFSGLRIYIPVDRHELDLSEFQVRDAEELAARAFQATFMTFLELWHDLAEYKGRIALRRPARESQHRGLERGMGLLGGVGGVALTSMIGSVPYAILLGGYAAAASGSYLDMMHYVYGHIYGRLGMAGQARPILRESLYHWKGMLQQRGVTAWRHLKPTMSPTRLYTLRSLADLPIRSSGRGHWAVKLVQAAVSSHASRIDFMFGRSAIEVRFCGVFKLTEQGESHLAEALPYLAREPLSEIVLSTDNGKTKLTNNSVSQEPVYVGEIRLQLVLPKSKGSFVDRIRQRIRGGCRMTAEASRYLEEFAWTSPTQVRIDQRILTTRYPHKRQELTEVYLDHMQRGLSLGLVRVVLPPRLGEPTLPLPAQHVVSPEKVESDGDLELVTEKLALPDTFAFWSADQDGRCGGVVVVTGDIRGNSAIEFVLDGVIVDTQPLYDPDDFILQDKVWKGLRLIKALPSPRVGMRCLVPIAADDLVDGRVKEPWKKLLHFLNQASPHLRRLVPELLEALPKLSYSASTADVKEKFKNYGWIDRRIAGGDAFREKKLFKRWHSKDLKRGVENFGDYLDGLLSRDDQQEGSGS